MKKKKKPGIRMKKENIFGSIPLFNFNEKLIFRFNLNCIFRFDLNYDFQFDFSHNFNSNLNIYLN